MTPFPASKKASWVARFPQYTQYLGLSLLTEIELSAFRMLFISSHYVKLPTSATIKDAVIIAAAINKNLALLSTVIIY